MRVILRIQPQITQIYKNFKLYNKPISYNVICLLITSYKVRMGSSPSKPSPPPPPPPPPTPPPPPPPPDPATLCRLRKVELNQIQSDLNNKQREVDSCDPQSVQARKTDTILKDINSFIQQQSIRRTEAIQQVESNIKINTDIKVAVQPLTELRNENTKLQKELEETNRKLIQSQRVQRRNFMDNDPQSGVSGLPGVRTTDDKVMLAFWLTIIPALIVLYLVGLQYFNIQIDTKGKIITGVFLIGIILGVIYWAITAYA